MRIGAVPYLNAKPLLWGIEHEITLAHPAILHRMMENNELDLALLPLFSFLANSRYEAHYEAGVIQSRGPVRSVALFYPKKMAPIEKISSIKLTPDSKTSVGLSKVITSQLWKNKDIKICDDNADAELLIGDEALLFNKPGYEAYDLGKAWQEWTHLPFTYATWISNKPIDKKLIEKLQEVKNTGLDHRKEIAQKQEIMPFGPTLTYLTENIYYDMNDQTIEGVAMYESYLHQLGLIPSKRYT